MHTWKCPLFCLLQISSSGATTIQHVPIPPSMGGTSGNAFQGPTHLPSGVGVPPKASPSHHASMVAAVAAVAGVGVSGRLLKWWFCSMFPYEECAPLDYLFFYIVTLSFSASLCLLFCILRREGWWWCGSESQWILMCLLLYCTVLLCSSL